MKRITLMLLDHENDPYDLHNLATQPALAEVVSKMRRLLRQIPGTDAQPKLTAEIDNGPIQT